MFIGHYAVGLAAKTVAPRASLGWQFAAVEFLDLVWPILVLAGVESFRIAPGITAFTPLDFVHYPWSHSLLMAVIWSAAFGGFYYWRNRDGRTAGILAGAVFSHWILDWITHRPDLPLAPGGDTRFGLGLWNSIAGTMVIEIAMFLGAAWFYNRTFTPRDRVGRWGFWIMIALLLLTYLANTQSVPPSVTAVAVSAMGMWLFVLWAWWVDRHRAARS
jgi:membrane-bound metal-dependent hydrolase YbcI (DUF457 family)